MRRSSNRKFIDLFDGVFVPTSTLPRCIGGSLFDRLQMYRLAVRAIAATLCVGLLATACGGDRPSVPPPEAEASGSLLALETRACNWLRPPNPDQCDDVRLVRIGLDGEVIEELGPPPEEAPMSMRNVAVSTDRRAIAWAWNWELYVMGLDDRQPRRLTEKLLPEALGERALDPAWSADGASIVYRWNGLNEEDRWYRVTVETGASERIEMPADCAGTAWQPGGRWMACEVVHHRGETQLTELVLVDLETNHLTQLTDPGDDVASFDAAWSPDGRWLAFAVWTEDGDPQVVGVYLYDSEAGRATRVVDGVISGPAWSPSGEHLTAFDEGSGTIVIFGADGSGLTSLDHEPRRFVVPNWYPAGP